MHRSENRPLASPCAELSAGSERIRHRAGKNRHEIPTSHPRPLDPTLGMDYGSTEPLRKGWTNGGFPPTAVSHWQSGERLQSTEAVRKRDCRYASRNNPLAALSIRFEEFNVQPGCDTKVLIVVTARRFHTASTHSRRLLGRHSLSGPPHRGGAVYR